MFNYFGVNYNCTLKKSVSTVKDITEQQNDERAVKSIMKGKWNSEQQNAQSRVKNLISSKKTKSAYENDALDLYKISGTKITE